MVEIDLSIMASSFNPATEIGPLLKEFETQYHVHVNLQVLSWDIAWVELVKRAVYRHGPDVSEVGLTWSVNLAGMNSLRLFSKAEVDSFGGESAFLPSMWKSEIAGGSQQRWSIPWSGHTYVLCYRKDILQNAGIDIDNAFAAGPQMVQTLARLSESGVAIPWVVPTANEYTRDNLHLMAAWIWGSGGRFISADGKRTLFNQPEARAGIKAYLELYRYLPRAYHNLGTTESQAIFLQGQAAVIVLSAPNVYQYFRSRTDEVAPVVKANLGAATMPGSPYVGGSNLVIWKDLSYAKEQAALKLVRFLTSHHAQLVYGQRSGIPPARLEALADSFFSEKPYDVVQQALLIKGRSYRSLERWGVIEEKLTEVMRQLRQEVLDNPQIDLDAVITKHIDPLAHRLDLMLAN